MQGTFHWLRVKIFCYATENEELIHDALVELIGIEEIDCDIADSEHGNKILILSCEISKQKEVITVFQKLGKDLCDQLENGLEQRIDEDCTLFLRLDKQDLVQEKYTLAHHGDVLSITGKVVSHPAKKENAVIKMKEFLSALKFPEDLPP
jgi:RNA binding exosome subunit